MEDDNLDTAAVVDGHGITMSAQVDKLFSALAKAQAAITNPQRNAENPFFNASYTDLTGVWDAARGPLSANGLSVTQLPGGSEWDIRLTTILAHESGQWLMSTFTLKASKPNAHGAGSALTYLRRYALASVVGIAPAGEDDDGNAAVEGQASQQSAPPVGQQKDNGSEERRGRKSNVDLLRNRLTGMGVTDSVMATKCVAYATDGRIQTIDSAKATPSEARKVLLALNAKVSTAGSAQRFIDLATGIVDAVEEEVVEGAVIDVNDA
jgi:hypothetical protein